MVSTLSPNSLFTRHHPQQHFRSTVHTIIPCSEAVSSYRNCQRRGQEGEPQECGITSVRYFSGLKPSILLSRDMVPSRPRLLNLTQLEVIRKAVVSAGGELHGSWSLGGEQGCLEGVAWGNADPIVGQQSRGCPCPGTYPTHVGPPSPPALLCLSRQNWVGLTCGKV